MSYPYVVHLDRMVRLQGTFNGTETSWTLPLTDDTLDTIVLSDGFNDAGKVLGVDGNNGSTVTKQGDYSAAEVIIGREFNATMELSRPYARNRSGEADVDAWLQIRQINLAHHRTGFCRLRGAMPRRKDRTVVHDVNPPTSGVLTGWLQGRAEELTLTVESESPKPFAVTGVEILADYAPRSR